MSGTAQTIANLYTTWEDSGAPGRDTPATVRNLVATIATRTPWIRATDPEYGATGNGVTDDTVALNAAATAAAGGVLMVPPGNYLITGSIILQTGTWMLAYGASFIAGALWPTPSSGDPAVATGYAMIANQNFNAAFNQTTKVDNNIRVLGADFSYAPLITAHGSDPASTHAVRFRMAQHVEVSQCTFLQGNDATAMLACDDVWITHNFANNCDNTAYDHWEGCTNTKVINNTAYMLTGATTSYGIEFTATNTAQTGTMTADGAIIIGNDIYNATGQGIAANTLSSVGPSLANRAVISGNNIYGNNVTLAGIVIFGGGTEHTIEGNNIYQITTGAIAVLADGLAVTATAVKISGNSCRNCTVASGYGAITVYGTASEVSNNTFEGGTRNADVLLYGNNNTCHDNFSDKALLTYSGPTGGATGCMVYGPDQTLGAYMMNVPFIKSQTTQALSTSSTVTVGVYASTVVTLAGSVTGVIMPAGVAGGQEFTIINSNASFTITFAAVATSHVINPAVIPVSGVALLTWDAVNSVWRQK